MGPCSTCGNTGDQLIRDTIFKCQVLLYGTIRNALTNRSHIFIRQLCMRRSLSAGRYPRTLKAPRCTNSVYRTLPVRVPPFTHHVVGVVANGAEKQVVVTNALWHIAVMAHAHPRGNGTIRQIPRDPMGEKVLLIDADVAIPRALSCTHPQPTTVQFLDFCPESGRSLSRKLHDQGLHGKRSPLRRCSRPVSASSETPRASANDRARRSCGRRRPFSTSLTYCALHRPSASDSSGAYMRLASSARRCCVHPCVTRAVRRAVANGMSS
jgi:hypothetical protein